MSKDEILELARKQPIVFVVDGCESIQRYPVEKIDFKSSWRRALFDIRGDECEVFATEKEAIADYKENIKLMLKEEKDDLTPRQKRNLRHDYRHPVVNDWDGGRYQNDNSDFGIRMRENQGVPKEVKE